MIRSGDADIERAGLVIETDGAGRRAALTIGGRRQRGAAVGEYATGSLGWKKKHDGHTRQRLAILILHLDNGRRIGARMNVVDGSLTGGHHDSKPGLFLLSLAQVRKKKGNKENRKRFNVHCIA